jgi:serine/threonine protein kinase
MIFNAKQILEIIEQRYQNTTFLQDRDTTSVRFLEKRVILFKHTRQSTDYVLKFYLLQHLDEGSKEKQFEEILNEYRIARALLGHPGFVKVFEIKKINNLGELIGVVMMMEYFPTTLDQYLMIKKQLSISEVMHFIQWMSRSLEYMHYRSSTPVVHADIKPANIGIRSFSGGKEYVLMDFDISVNLINANNQPDLNISNMAPLRGLTPQYAAPEQVAASINRSGNISNRVDIYAVGVIAIQMLTGQLPRKRENEVFYNVPLFKVADPLLRKRLGRLVHPDPKQRVKKIHRAFKDESQEWAFSIRTINFQPGPAMLKRVFFLLATTIIVLIVVYLFSALAPSTKPDSPAVVPADTSDGALTYPEVSLVYMPYVLGTSLNQAKQLIEYQGLQLGKVSYIDYLLEYRGMVLYATYSPGDIIKRGTYVNLYIGQ